jgi:hypothetical protein
MYIVLDTNILHQEGLFSRNMKVLERIAQSGKITVCVPELVLQEFTTRKVTDARELLKKSKDVFPEVKRRLPGSDIANLAQLIEELTEEFKDALEESYENAINEWKTALNVETLIFNPAILSTVFNDYFSGKGAFRAPKEREDIPDSFIAHSILPLADTGRIVNVVLKDGVLKKHLSSKNLAIFDDLTSLFASEPFKKISDELDASTRNVDELKIFLASIETVGNLMSFIKTDIKGLEEIYVENDEISGCEILEMDSFGVSINGITPQGVLSISLGDVSYVEPGYFSISMIIVANTHVSFVASYMEFSNLQPPRDKFVEMESMNGDGWAELTEMHKVNLHGHLQLKFDSKWTEKDLSPHMQYLAASNSAVQITMDINTAELL